MRIDLHNLTIRKAHQHMLDGDFTSRELTEAYLQNIKEKNSNINAYLHIFEENALKQADEADKRFAEGTAELLTGIPMAVLLPQLRWTEHCLLWEQTQEDLFVSRPVFVEQLV